MTTDPLIGALVTYNGTLGTITPLRAEACRCRTCVTVHAPADAEVMLMLFDPEDGTPVLRHPRRASLSPAEAPA